jgi:hypothetical protein
MSFTSPNLSPNLAPTPSTIPPLVNTSSAVSSAISTSSTSINIPLPSTSCVSFENSAPSNYCVDLINLVPSLSPICNSSISPNPWVVFVNLIQITSQLETAYDYAFTLSNNLTNTIPCTVKTNMIGSLTTAYYLLYYSITHLCQEQKKKILLYLLLSVILI